MVHYLILTLPWQLRCSLGGHLLSSEAVDTRQVYIAKDRELFRLDQQGIDCRVTSSVREERREIVECRCYIC